MLFQNTYQVHWIKIAIDNQTNKEGSLEQVPVDISPDPTKPLVAMAFKITEDSYGQLTYTRVYQGTITRVQVFTIPYW